MPSPSLVGSAHAATADTGGPTGLHAFLLRTDEPAQTSFSRTPSFAWNPVSGALHYEFQLSLSNTFHDNSVVYADLNVVAPVEAPGITLPWITGNPHSLYARVRAITTAGATPWSASFGFDMVAPAAPKPLPGYPGVLRWSAVEGAAAYEVWFIDIPKFVSVTTNVLDEREFYTFHPTTNWMGTIRWRIRAIRADIVFASNSGTSRYNKIPAVQYGPWSPVYSSTNGAFPTNPKSTSPTNPIGLVGTVSDVFSDGSNSSPAHKLMPAFLWRGNQTLGGTPAELFRVYVFSDKQCLNPVFIGSVVGSPGYAPRPYGSLILPTTPVGIASARNSYLSDGTEPPGYMFDWTPLSGNSAPNEDQPHVTPQTIVAGTPGDNSATPGSSSGGGSSSSGGGLTRPSAGTLTWSGDFGAPVDLWDTDWPQSGYYWTVVGVDAEVPGFLETSVTAPGALSAQRHAAGGVGGGLPGRRRGHDRQRPQRRERHHRRRRDGLDHPDRQARVEPRPRRAGHPLRREPRLQGHGAAAGRLRAGRIARFGKRERADADAAGDAVRHRALLDRASRPPP